MNQKVEECEQVTQLLGRGDLPSAQPKKSDKAKQSEVELSQNSLNITDNTQCSNFVQEMLATSAPKTQTLYFSQQMLLCRKLQNDSCHSPLQNA
jgi:hypothetical protein